MRELLEKIFSDLNNRIVEENHERDEAGGLTVPKCEVTLLGQVSLLANDRVSAFLSLAQTGDLDALISNTFSKGVLKEILERNGLIYDEDSEKIWIPPGAKFETLFKMSHVSVKIIDAESALVSKAIKAPQKNKQLIRQAIASNKFKALVNRILDNGGKLENFI